jgi:hypothetical protein
VHSGSTAFGLWVWHADARVKDRFPDDRRCVFVAAPHLGRDAALMAAARVHVKPSALTGVLPTFSCASSDAREVAAVLAEARSVDVDAWAVSLREVEALERLRRVDVFDATVRLVTQRGERPFDFGALGAFVDVRWKAGAERRVQVLLPRLGEGVLVVPSELEVTGPSRQAGELQVMIDLQRRAAGRAPARVLAQAVLPAQVGAPADVPAEVVAVALAEAVRAREDRRLSARGPR